MDLKFEFKLEVWIAMVELFEFKTIAQSPLLLFSNTSWKVFNLEEGDVMFICIFCIEKDYEICFCQPAW